MTTRYITTACLALTFFMNAQEPGGGTTDPFDFLENKDKIVEVPQSPEVAAFEKYGNLPVNFYAGAPEISIPVFTHKGKEMSLPISLTYDATGIKVEQIATNVGLGWNLNFGGVVSREVKHLPDDLYASHQYDVGYNGYELITDTETRNLYNLIRYNNPPIHSMFNGVAYNPNSLPQSTAIKMHDFYKKYKADIIDLQPDEFNFNVNGLSGKLFINYDNNTAYCITDPNIKAQFTYGYNNNKAFINKWIITDAAGTKYTFDKIEFSYNHITEDTPQPWGDNPFREYDREFSTAWFLTKIESPNDLDSYELFYSDPVYWKENYRILNVSHTGSLRFDANQNNYTITLNFAGNNDYKKKQFYLTQIKYNNSLIFSTELADRDDIVLDVNNQKMKRFSRFKMHDVFGQVIQQMDLHHSYFKQSPYQNTDDWRNSRLKLDEILIYKGNVADAKKYIFSYIMPNEIPFIDSNAIDFWGYYNGNNGNQHSIPNTLGVTILGSFNAANRNPSLYHTSIGTLESIIYPTGGKTTFEYEQHKGFNNNYYDAVNGVVGGLRIHKQKSETLDDINSTITKFYYYGDANELTTPYNLPSNYTPDGKIHQLLQFWNSSVSQDENGGTQTNYFLASQNAYISAPNHVAYTFVSEIEYNGIEYNASTFNGFTVYEFYNDDIELITNLDYPWTNQKPANGKSHKKAIYDKNKNLLTEETSFYDNIELGLDQFTGGHGLFIYNVNGYPGAGYGCSYLANGFFYIKSLYETGQNPLGGCPPGIGLNGDLLGYPFDNYNISPYTYYSFFWAKLGSSIEKNYFTNNTNPVITTTNYTYNSNRLTSEVLKTFSNNEIKSTEIFYPQDLINQGEPDNPNLLQLVNRNSISSPVKVLNYKNGNITGSQRKYFINQGTLPSKISASKSNLALEDKVLFHQYDTYGNPVRISYADAPQKYYIWGYNHQLLLGQIENWPQNPSSEIQNKIAQIISLSNNPITTTQQLINEFALLRGMVGLINAEVTSFTHRPGIGVSTVTDAKGDTIYYYYDDNNRLSYVIDKDGKYLAEHEYNFRINP